MKTILYMATSINGYITNGDNDSNWVTRTDWKQFDKLLRVSGVIVMGKHTYEQFGNDFPVNGAFNIVMTHDPQLLKNSIPDKALFTDKSPQEVLEFAEKKGFTQVMLIGGMTLNAAYMQEHLIDEIWLSVHPYFIGEGKTLMESFPAFEKLKFLGSTELEEGLVQLRYKVL